MTGYVATVIGGLALAVPTIVVTGRALGGLFTTLWSECGAVPAACTDAHLKALLLGYGLLMGAVLIGGLGSAIAVKATRPPTLAWPRAATAGAVAGLAAGTVGGLAISVLGFAGLALFAEVRAGTWMLDRVISGGLFGLLVALMLVLPTAVASASVGALTGLLIRGRQLSWTGTVLVAAGWALIGSLVLAASLARPSDMPGWTPVNVPMGAAIGAVAGLLWALLFARLARRMP